MANNQNETLNGSKTQEKPLKHKLMCDTLPRIHSPERENIPKTAFSAEQTQQSTTVLHLAKHLMYIYLCVSKIMSKRKIECIIECGAVDVEKRKKAQSTDVN